MNAGMAPAAELSSAVQFGSWSLGALPAGWELVGGHGIRNANEGAFPSTVILGEDALRAGTTLDEYVKAQQVVISAYLPEARHTEIRQEKSADADEAVWLEIELPGPVAPATPATPATAATPATPAGDAGVMRQLYARFGAQVGIVTFTTLASFDDIRVDPRGSDLPRSPNSRKRRVFSCGRSSTGRAACC